MTPERFLAVYECEECGEEYDMENCYVPYIFLPCDYCNDLTRFVASKIIHKKFEWDYLEDDEH